MPKLSLEINHEFDAGPIRASRNHQTKSLKPKEIIELIGGSEKSDFSLNVTFLDPDEGWPMVGFEMYSKPSRKDDIFEWKIDENTGSVKIKVHALLESKALRSGVAPTIQKLGSKADLRLASFSFKGGVYSGFEAPVIGQGDEDFKHWYKIEKWQLK